MCCKCDCYNHQNHKKENCGATVCFKCDYYEHQNKEKENIEASFGRKMSILPAPASRKRQIGPPPALLLFCRWDGFPQILTENELRKRRKHMNTITTEVIDSTFLLFCQRQGFPQIDLEKELHKRRRHMKQITTEMIDSPILVFCPEGRLSSDSPRK